MSAGQGYDRRRNNGPETSFAPLFQIDEEERRRRTAAKGKAPVRGDGRRSDALRPIFLQCGLIPQASGSAYIEMGNMKIACAVYGPRQIRGRKYSGKAELNVDVRYSPFSCEVRRRPGRDAESSSLSHSIQEALLPSLRLDLLPKASIDVFINILEADAPEVGCVAAGATVASTALAEAGVEMYGLVAGVCGVLSLEEDSSSGVKTTLLVDPTHAEAKEASGIGAVQLCAMPAIGSVTSMRQSFRKGLTIDLLDSTIEQLMVKTAEVHLVMAKTLSESAGANPS